MNAGGEGGWRYCLLVVWLLACHGVSTCCCCCAFLTNKNAGFAIRSKASRTTSLHSSKFVGVGVISRQKRAAGGTPLSVAAPEQATTENKYMEKMEQIQELKESFLSKIENSLKDGTFVSLVFKGPTKKKKTKKKSTKLQQLLEHDEFLRGCIKQIQGRRILLKEQEYLQVTFKYHGATDIAKNWELGSGDNTNDDLRQALSAILNFPEHKKDNNIVMESYIPASEWGEQYFTTAVALAEGEDLDVEALQHLVGIQTGTLTTTDGAVVELDVGFATKKPRIKQQQVTVTESKTATTLDSLPVSNHDRAKSVPLDPASDFLRALAVTDADGKPKRAMASKLRQCQKFVEIVGGLVDKVLADQSTISVLDMGCGRGYLTFSLHSYLQTKLDTQVHSVGIDVRPKLVKEINGIAQSLGADFESLTFEDGSIEDVMLATNNNNQAQQSPTSSSDMSSSLDILIALHACDTATDDALWCGISRQADVIVVAPCCHKQIRPQLNAVLSSRNKQQHPLADMLRHNVYRERQAEMVTDSIRALLLELAGYQVQVFEFIGGEHTAKNVMITAVRNQRTTSSTSAQNSKQTKDLQTRLEALGSLHGIRQQKLAQWMSDADYELGEARSLAMTTKAGRIPPGSMPPL